MSNISTNMGTHHNRRQAHFSMDERGIGGRHLLQQQFHALSSNVRRVHKMIDNDPPFAMGWSRRITSDKFIPYYKRVPQLCLLSEQVVGKTDSRPPPSYQQIAKMYINTPADKRPASTRPAIGRSARYPPVMVNPADQPLSARENRQREIREHLENLRYRRWCRQQSVDGGLGGPTEIGRIADQALEAMRASHPHAQHDPSLVPASVYNALEAFTVDGPTPTPTPVPPPRARAYTETPGISVSTPNPPLQARDHNGDRQLPPRPRPHSAATPATGSRRHSCTILM